MEKLKVVVFSGGRGAASILESLVAHPQVAVTALVNAYDDGLSTGRLRAFVPGMLGPSDIRKNIGTLMPNIEACDVALKKLLDFRFKEGTTRDSAMASLNAFTNSTCEIADKTLNSYYLNLSIKHSKEIATYISHFLSYELAASNQGRNFDYADCSIGNLIFTGCYLLCDEDFNRTVKQFSEFCRVRGRIYNITDGRNYVLVALKADGSYVPNETLIVSPQSNVPISEIFLLEQYLDKAIEVSLAGMPLDARRHYLHSIACYPKPNSLALDAIAEADLIIYGPGTQHSSLFPSYHTAGLAHAIKANSKAEKVFVGNITHDHDIANETVQGLVALFIKNMMRAATHSIEPQNLITKLFIQKPDNNSYNRAVLGTYIPYEISSLSLEHNSVRAKDWETGAGHHSGGQIVDEIFLIAKNLMDIKIRPLRHMISIIVPMLNEAATIDRVLNDLEKLDMTSSNIMKEVIVVDGGSTDGSLEIACKHQCIRVYSLNGTKGRGAAFRLGVEKARGNLIILFPADNEYSCEDILQVANPIIENKFNVVFGSRAIKCLNLGKRIRSIYGKRHMDYLLSKYGGMALSIASLFLYSRYITDPLSTLKAYDKELLTSLDMKSNGVNLECEIIGKLVHREEYILEVPVQYNPRTKEQGKKITFSDGLLSMIALLRYRFISKHDYNTEH